MYYHRDKRSRQAFTLIEVLIAMTILSVSVTGVFAVFLLGLQTTARASNLSQAIDVACNVLNEASVLPTDSATGLEGTTGRFGWSVVVKQKPENLTLITSTVRWSEGGEPHEYKLSRLFLPKPQNN